MEPRSFLNQLFGNRAPYYNVFVSSDLIEEAKKELAQGIPGNLQTSGRIVTPTQALIAEALTYLPYLPIPAFEYGFAEVAWPTVAQTGSRIEFTFHELWLRLSQRHIYSTESEYGDAFRRSMDLALCMRADNQTWTFCQRYRGFWEVSAGGNVVLALVSGECVDDVDRQATKPLTGQFDRQIIENIALALCDKESTITRPDNQLLKNILQNAEATAPTCCGFGEFDSTRTGAVNVLQEAAIRHLTTRD